MSQHSNNSDPNQVAGGCEAQDEPSLEPASGAVEQQNVQAASAHSVLQLVPAAHPARPAVPVHGDDVRRLNSGVSAMKLLEQSCPHLLAGATGYMLTAQHLYRVTRYACLHMTRIHCAFVFLALHSSFMAGCSMLTISDAGSVR